jgi:hypothetical protein
MMGDYAKKDEIYLEIKNIGDSITRQVNKSL